MRNASRLLPVAAASVLASPAFAAAVDVSDVVTDIGLQVTPITAIGGGILLLLVAIKAFKWVRRAM
jgi:hypothetical protein